MFNVELLSDENKNNVCCKYLSPPPSLSVLRFRLVLNVTVAYDVLLVYILKYN